MYMPRLVTLAHDGADKISRPWIFKIIINLNLVAWNGDKNFDVDHGCLADHFSQRLFVKRTFTQTFTQTDITGLDSGKSVSSDNASAEGSGACSPEKFLNFHP